MPIPTNDLRPIVQALQGGHPREAEALARARLAAGVHDRSGLTLLALALQAQDRAGEALAVHAELTRRYPHEPLEWNNFGTMLRQCGQLEDAARAYRRGLELAPGHAGLLLNAGLLENERGDPVGALECFMRAHAADPRSLELRIHAALANIQCGEVPLAQELVGGWAAWEPVAPEHLLDLGWALGMVGQTADAEALLRRALEEPVDAVSARARLAMLLERNNRLDEARALVDGLPAPAAQMPTALRNDIVSAQAALAIRESEPAGARALLEGMLAQADGPVVRMNVLFLLARACDRLDDRRAAMESLGEAHRLQTAIAARLEPEIAVPGYEPLKRAARYLDAARFAAWPRLAPAADPATPVFIVGFPRSGTTLLEQVLDAHPGLSSMDERAFLQDLIEHMRTAWGLDYPDGLGELDAARCDELRALYASRVAATGCHRPGTRLVDKNPLNILRLPLIMRLFPDAPIILALRHPCDVILSCYMQNFRTSVFALLCSTLETLARGYVNAMNFWIHHAAFMRPNACVLRYEELIGDFPGHVRRLADLLGLDDVEPMLRYHEHVRGKGYISTPSYAQVVQPPNRKAVDRWRRYADDFAPILPILAPLLEHWGYAD